MSTKKRLEINSNVHKSVYGAIRVSEGQWWMKNFAKQSFEEQQRWYREALSWVDERPIVKEMFSQMRERTKKDAIHILAASFWGQVQHIEKLDRALEENLAAWSDRYDDAGRFVPISY